MNRVSAPGRPSMDRLQVLLQFCLTVSSKCISLLSRSRPPSAAPNSLKHGFQVYLPTPSIMASNCISRITRLQPPSSHDRRLQVHLKPRSIMASMFASSWPPSASPKSLDHDLRVHLYFQSMTMFRHTSNCSQAPPAASPDIPCVDG